MLFDKKLTDKAETLLKLAGEKHMRVATAESCTGGLISALLTEIPGSSVVIGRSFVTYSNRAKHEILHVPAELLREQLHLELVLLQLRVAEVDLLHQTLYQIDECPFPIHAQ